MEIIRNFTEEAYNITIRSEEKNNFSIKIKVNYEPAVSLFLDAEEIDELCTFLKNSCKFIKENDETWE